MADDKAKISDFLIDALLRSQSGPGPEDDIDVEPGLLAEFLAWNRGRTDLTETFGTSALLLTLVSASLNMMDWMQLSAALKPLLTWSAPSDDPQNYLALMAIETSSGQVEDGGIDKGKAKSAYTSLMEILKAYPQLRVNLHIGRTTDIQKGPTGPALDALLDETQSHRQPGIYLSPKLIHVLGLDAQREFKSSSGSFLERKGRQNLWLDQDQNEWDGFFDQFDGPTPNLSLKIRPAAMERDVEAEQISRRVYTAEADGLHYYLCATDGRCLHLAPEQVFFGEPSPFSDDTDWPWILLSNHVLDIGILRQALSKLQSPTPSANESVPPFLTDLRDALSTSPAIKTPLQLGLLRRKSLDS